ncbi:MAG: DUF2911 domain-containing protein [Bacteroidota bacterium]
MTARKFTFMLLAVLLFTSSQLIGQSVTLPRTPSPQAEVIQTIGISTVTINYSRPAVREREIWGTQLAHYGYQNLGFGTAEAAPWRGGANENTMITFSHAATVEGKKIPAGTYGLFFGLYEDGKVDVIFSKNSESWGSYYYSQNEDLIRVTVNAVEIPHKERLTFDFTHINKTTVTAVLDWEKKRIPFKIEFDVDAIVLANAENELRSVTGFFWQGPMSAAQYCLNNNVELEKGLAWVDQSIGMQKNFNNMSVKAQILDKMGKKEESQNLMDEAIKNPAATTFQVHGYGRRLIAQGKKDKALEVFLYNYKKNKGAWPTNYGLARAYSAKGDFKKAIKYLKVARTNVPANDRFNGPAIESNLKKLEKGEDIN